MHATNIWEAEWKGEKFDIRSQLGIIEGLCVKREIEAIGGRGQEEGGESRSERGGQESEEEMEGERRE